MAVFLIGASVVLTGTSAAVLTGSSPASAYVVPTGPVTPTNAGQQTTTIDYGPFTVPASTKQMMPGDNEVDMTGMGMIQNQPVFGVAKPCSNCMLTSITPSLVYSDGSPANVDSGAWLHHMVLGDSGPGKSDATCGFSILSFLGERFFASGNERTEVVFPNGYGYPVGSSDTFNAIVDLMNLNMTPINVKIRLKYTWVPGTGSSSTSTSTDPLTAFFNWLLSLFGGSTSTTPTSNTTVKPVRPVWLDLNECFTSEITVPAGPSDPSWSWTSNVSGNILAIGGHIHDYGRDIYAKDDTTGQTICDSVGTYGGTPAYIDMMGFKHLSRMTGCLATSGSAPVATIKSGDTISIHAHYDPPAQDAGVMGIMLMYVASS